MSNVVELLNLGYHERALLRVEHVIKEQNLLDAYVMEKLVSNNYYLTKSAKDAYRSYILAYNSHSMKDIFNVHSLDLQAIAASFCFSTPPKVSLNINNSA